MMKQAVVGIVILVAGVLPAFGQDFPADLSPSEKLYGLSLFWKEVSYNFAYFDQVPELDWDKVYREYLPKVLETRSTFEYYRTLQRFCALLKDGHTNVSIPRAMWDEYMDRPPVAVAQIQGKPVIVNLAQSLAPEVPLGSEILRIDGTPSRQYLEKEVIPYISSSTEHIRWNDAIFRILDGPKGSRVKMEFRTPGGEVGTVTVVRNARQSTEEWVKQRNLTRPLTKFRWMEDGIAYVALNSFNNSKIVDEFDALLPEVRKAKAVILDLRGNPGGSTENGTAILDHFTDRPLAGSAWRTREHRAANKAWGKFDMDRGDSESLNARYFRGVVWYSSFHDTLYPTNEPKILVLSLC